MIEAWLDASGTPWLRSTTASAEELGGTPRSLEALRTFLPPAAQRAGFERLWLTAGEGRPALGLCAAGGGWVLTNGRVTCYGTQGLVGLAAGWGRLVAVQGDGTLLVIDEQQPPDPETDPLGPLVLDEFVTACAVAATRPWTLRVPWSLEGAEVELALPSSGEVRIVARWASGEARELRVEVAEEEEEEPLEVVWEGAISTPGGDARGG